MCQRTVDYIITNLHHHRSNCTTLPHIETSHTRIVSNVRPPMPATMDFFVALSKQGVVVLDSTCHCHCFARLAQLLLFVLQTLLQQCCSNGRRTTCRCIVLRRRSGRE